MELINKNQELFKENAKHKREMESLTEKLDQTDKQLNQLNVIMFNYLNRIKLTQLRQI